MTVTDEDVEAVADAAYRAYTSLERAEAPDGVQ
jgi:hypothetical protein